MKQYCENDVTVNPYFETTKTGSTWLATIEKHAVLCFWITTMRLMPRPHIAMFFCEKRTQ
jgi:hypothetical protein